MRAPETAEIEALRDLFASAPADLSSEHGLGVLELGAALAVRVRSLSGLKELNHAVGLADPEALLELDAFYGETTHAVSPDPDADLEPALRSAGYAPDYAWMKFERGVELPPSGETDLRLLEVGKDAADDFGRTACTAYGLPDFVVSWTAQLPGREGWHCFVAYDGDLPVATGALHVHEDLGWLGLAATLPSHRGRGAQNAILAARIARARERDCRSVTTETGERVPGRPSNSYRNILRNGFAEAYLRPNWVKAAGRAS
jgi:hypothetical protein